jgi:SOS-response transcriptional repressor LexA
MTSIPAQLKALRNRTQPKISSRAMGDLLGIPGSSYGFYEDATKYKKPILPLDLAKRIAIIFADHGVPEEETLALAGITGEFGSFPTSPIDDDANWLEVQGTVAAGIWRDQTTWPAKERYLARFGPSRYKNHERFAVRMEGLSMNRTIPSGSELECLWIKFSPIPPRPGDLVIVERHNHDLVELTCKRLAMDGENYILLAESTEPEFAAPIHVGKPDNGMFIDDEVRVVGIVLSAKLNLAPTNLDDRRYHNE